MKLLVHLLLLLMVIFIIDIWAEYFNLKDVLKEFLGGEKFIKNEIDCY